MKLMGWVELIATLKRIAATWRPHGLVWAHSDYTSAAS